MSVLLNRGPWLFPVTETWTSLQSGLGEHGRAPGRAGGCKDALLPVECPAWGQVRASPSKTLDVCGVRGWGLNANCFALQTYSNWAMLLCWCTDSLCLHVKKVLKMGRNRRDERSVIHKAKSSNDVCCSVLILCAFLFARSYFYFQHRYFVIITVFLKNQIALFTSKKNLR